MNLRFLVDYNDEEENNRVPISEGNIYLRQANSENIKQLRPGQQITVYDLDGLEFDAIAGFDEQYQYWYSVVDSSTRREAPLG